MNAPAPLRGARAAFVFLTRLPVGGFPYRSEDWAWSTAHFPLVGAVLGVFLGGIHRLLWPLGPTLDAVLVLAASMLLTGGFHEDGLADTSDALGGGFDREKILAILKDSRVGVFGASAVVFSIVARVAALSALGRDAPWLLPIVGCGARVGPIWQMLALPYATPPSASRSRDVVVARPVQAWVATSWFVLVCALEVQARLLSPMRAVAVAGVMAAVTLVSGWRYARRLGGITGDFLGATEQLCEIGAYAALVWGHG